MQIVHKLPPILQRFRSHVSKVDDRLYKATACFLIITLYFWRWHAPKGFTIGAETDFGSNAFWEGLIENNVHIFAEKALA